MNAPPLRPILLTAAGLLACGPVLAASAPPAQPAPAPAAAPAPAPAPPAAPAAAPAVPASPGGRPAAAPDAPATPAPVRKVAAVGILGRDVLGPDGQLVGRVVDVLVDPGSNPRAAVIDFGGFLGVGSRRIAINWSDLSFPPVSADGTAGAIRLDLTPEQIMAAPQYTDQTKPAAVVEPPPAASALVKPGPATGH